jgi:hypothetical protein
MAEQPTETQQEEGQSTPTPARQPGFLARLDSALGLQLAVQTPTPPSTDQDGHPGQSTSAEMDARVPSGNLRPGFFGAKGSL